jgi:superfamily II DNA/RNA helicase
VPSRIRVTLRGRNHITSLSSHINRDAHELVSQLDQDNYLFGQKPVSFSDTGLCKSLVSAMSRLGYTHPTKVQGRSIPHILRGIDVVLGAETGSGKTLSYLLPLIDMTMARTHTEHVKESLDDRDIDIVDSSDDGVRHLDHVREDNTYIKYPSAAILLPNKDLCNQVLEVATRVMNELSSECNITIGENTRLTIS